MKLKCKTITLHIAALRTGFECFTFVVYHFKGGS